MQFVMCVCTFGGVQSAVSSEDFAPRLLISEKFKTTPLKFLSCRSMKFEIL